jgi:DNA-binding NtrC family response regulator
MKKLNKTVLIVDDDMDYLFQTKFNLENAGFDTITAESQKEAETILKETKFDAAVFDLMMESDDSGFILAYKCKKLYPNIPIVINTGVASETGYSFDSSTDWVKADLYFEKGSQTANLALEIKRLLKI